MFDKIELITVDEKKNDLGEIIEIESKMSVPAQPQSISHQRMDLYAIKGYKRALRFKISLPGMMPWIGTVPSFRHSSGLYTTTDFYFDKTGTTVYIEGVRVDNV